MEDINLNEPDSDNGCSDVDEQPECESSLVKEPKVESEDNEPEDN